MTIMTTMAEAFRRFCDRTGATEERDRATFYAGATMVIKLIRDNKIPLENARR